MQEKGKIFYITRSLVVSYVFTILMLLGWALILYKTKMNEKQIAIGVNVVYFAGCFVGAFLLGKGMKIKRLVWGIILGLVYFLILYLLSLLINRGLYQGVQHCLFVLALCMGGGAVGGAVS